MIKVSSLRASCSRQGFEAPLLSHPLQGSYRKALIFLTDNFVLPGLTITELYRCR